MNFFQMNYLRGRSKLYSLPKCLHLSGGLLTVTSDHATDHLCPFYAFVMNQSDQPMNWDSNIIIIKLLLFQWYSLERLLQQRRRKKPPFMVRLTFRKSPKEGLYWTNTLGQSCLLHRSLLAWVGEQLWWRNGFIINSTRGEIVFAIGAHRTGRTLL